MKCFYLTFNHNHAYSAAIDLADKYSFLGNTPSCSINDSYLLLLQWINTFHLMKCPFVYPHMMTGRQQLEAAAVVCKNLSQQHPHHMISGKCPADLHSLWDGRLHLVHKPVLWSLKIRSRWQNCWFWSSFILMWFKDFVLYDTRSSFNHLNKQTLYKATFRLFQMIFLLLQYRGEIVYWQFALRLFFTWALNLTHIMHQSRPLWLSVSSHPMAMPVVCFHGNLLDFFPQW